MTVKTPMKFEEPMKEYKRLLLTAATLQAENGGKVFDRITTLVRVYRNEDFREEVLGVDDANAMAILDDLLEDVCLTFLELDAMLARFPNANESPWSDGKLASAYDRMCQEKVVEDEPVERTKRKHATRKEVEEVTEQMNRARGELTRANEKLTELDLVLKENAQLRARISGLEQELKALQSIVMQTA